MTTTVLDRPASTVPGRRLADRRPPLARLVGLEIRKSLSTRSGVALTGAAAVLPAAATALMVALHDSPPGAATMLALLGTLVGMLLIAVGVLSTAGEWTHGTVQTTFLTVPRRDRVLAAKYAGAAVLGAAISAVVVATTFAVAAVGAGADFSWAGTGVAVVATVGAGAALTVVGAGIGAAIGNAPAALTGTYLVLLVGMTVLNSAKPVWGKHVDPLSAMFDLIEGDAAVRPVAVLAGWLVATAVAGIAVTRRRAIS
jgi:ABC-2 type transport system permease protein